MIDASAFKYRTGTPWMDLPERFGSWKGVHNRLRVWAADGTWAKLFAAGTPKSGATCPTVTHPGRGSSRPARRPSRNSSG
ncbi:transposase [Streptomyces vinaceus]|uniref:transposase n=1 Tax=Streptomyces vinaceus TaxID=1960 RepID=UPI0038239F5A